MNYFIQPVTEFINLQTDIQKTVLITERLEDVFLSKEEDTFISTTEINSLYSDISINNMSFAYDNKFVLDKINIYIKPGQKIAIVGESGSGKTTIAKLLMRFYEPTKGSISVGNAKLKDLSINFVRSNIAYVAQETYFFSDTIKNNLLYGNSEVSEEYFNYVSNICCLYKIINELPLGYDTLLEENASNLSGGQRQLLSIARALLRDPDILILDEATSHLDTILESEITANIANTNNNMTQIIIAHRLNTIINSDKIYVLNKGEIIEEGTYKKLLNQKGYFFNFISKMKLT